MKNIYSSIFSSKNLLGSLLLVAAACQPKFYEEPSDATATSGSADFSKYVAVGSSITAGFADNALFDEGQANAYPNLIAQQIKKANSSLSFVQPDVNSANGWRSGSVSGTALGRSVLAYPTGGCNSAPVSPASVTTDLTAVPAYTGDITQLTNLAVPFLSAKDLNVASLSTSSSASTSPSPYYKRIVNTSTTKGIASEAKARGASFFTVWIGYQDALTNATSGGATAALDLATYQANIEALVDSLLSVPGAKGAIANIPYVDLLPAVTNNNRRLTSSTDPARSPGTIKLADILNYNTSLGGYVFSTVTGASATFAIKTGAGATRQMSVTKDFITSSSVLDQVGKGAVDSLMVRACTQNLTQRKLVGLASAIPANNVFDADEISALRTVVANYNAALKAIVDAHADRLVLVDLNSFYTKLTDASAGIQYNSLIIRANQPSLGPDFGGFYSTDRTHPTPRGQAALANEFIKAINTKFGATIPLLDPADYRGNVVPSE